MPIRNPDIKNSQIALVDDEPKNLDLLESILKSEGYTNLIKFERPTRLITYLQEEEVDLILLDYNMPIIDGLGVLQWADGFYKSCNINEPYIIMLTAQSEQSYRVKALEQGAQDYVTKPFDTEELLHRIQNQLEKRLLNKKLIYHNNNLESLVKQRTFEVQKAYLEMIERLGKAAEYRDNETSNHVNRVSLYAEILAKKYGKSKEEARLIRLASTMHDIGKVGISDNILLKPGKLTHEEFSTMKEHVNIGASILEGATTDLLILAHQIALTHHEKYNGTGYPNNLAGEDIPIAGRIVAVADVFDALTSNRPYKKAWPIEDAFALLEKEKGEHFDPVIIDLFIEAKKDILAINKKYQDEF